MTETAEFTLLNISLLDYYFQPNLKDFVATTDDVMWYFTFNFSLNPASNNGKYIRIQLSYKLYYKNDPEKKQIAFVEISNLFSFKGEVSINSKLEALLVLMSITEGNLQGIYAAKTEASPLSPILPPSYNWRKYSADFIKKIENEWK